MSFQIWKRLQTEDHQVDWRDRQLLWRNTNLVRSRNDVFAFTPAKSVIRFLGVADLYPARSSKFGVQEKYFEGARGRPENMPERFTL